MGGQADSPVAVSVSAGRTQAARIAIVGGCGGIGRALVESLTGQGARIAVLDLPASLQRHQPPPNVQCVALDATDARAVALAADELQSEWQSLDGLVYLTGYMPAHATLAGTDEVTLRECIDVNLVSAFHVTKSFIPLLSGGDAPAVVLAASGLGAYARPGMGHYSLAKAGIIAMTRQLALEHAPAVRINAVAPSAVDTAFLRGGTGRSNEDEAPHVNVDAYKTVTPLGRIAVPTDVTGPIEFLLSCASGYMTGQTLYINGGTYTG